MTYSASSSFGKDSVATILLALKHQEPLDLVIYCEVMFDDTVSGEVPEHRDFIYQTAIPWLQKQGIPVKIVRGKHTYVSRFTGPITSGPKQGKLRAFPICGKCYVQRDCKSRPLDACQKALGRDTVTYVGIAADEKKRLASLGNNKISLLAKYHYNQKDAMELCREAGLLSPIYEFSNRGGCWFCPNAGTGELRHLYDCHPELWDRLRTLNALPNKVSEKFNRTETLPEVERRLLRRGMEEKMPSNPESGKEEHIA